MNLHDPLISAEQEADNLLTAKRSNPCRAAFGFGHLMTSTVAAFVPLIVAESIGSPFTGFAAVLTPLVAACTACARNAHAIFNEQIVQEMEIGRTIQIEYADFASKNWGKHGFNVSPMKALCGGAWNGIKKNVPVNMCLIVGWGALHVKAVVEHGFRSAAALVAPNHVRIKTVSDILDADLDACIYRFRTDEYLPDARKRITARITRAERVKTTSTLHH